MREPEWSVDRLKSEIAVLGTRGLSREEYFAELAPRVRRVVDSDASCWRTIDPQTRLLTSDEPRELVGAGIYTPDTVELNGVAPAGAFHYDPKVRTATLGPPAPFAGTAHLTRSRNSVSPLLGGDLKLTFPGHTVRLAGPGVHVSLEHARLTHGDGGNISVGI
jgi:hypothetical protein